MTFESAPNVGSTFSFTFKIESRVGEVQDQLEASNSLKFRWRPNPEQFIGGQEIRYILKQANTATPAPNQPGSPHNNQVFSILPYKNEVNMQQQSFTMMPLNIDDVRQRLQKILIVDDEAYNINALIILFEIILKIDIKTTCERALSGPEAIQMVKDDLRNNNNQRSSYSLILMDCEMPIMNGFETTDKLRHVLYLHDVLQPLVVAMTTNCGDKYVERALDSGMNSVLQKPV